MAAPANMFLPDSRPAVPLPRFSRHLHASEGDGGESGEVCVRFGLYTQVSQLTGPRLSLSKPRPLLYVHLDKYSNRHFFFLIRLFILLF